MSSRIDPERRRRALSLSARLAIWFAAAVFALTVAISAILYQGLSASLRRTAEEHLEDQVGILRAILRDHPDDPRAIQQEVELESLARRHARIFIRILDDAAIAIAATPDFPADLAPELFPAPLASGGETLRSAEIRAASGREYLAVGARLPLGRKEGESRVVQVALDMESDREIRTRFWRRMLYVLALSLPYSALVGLGIARRGLAPLTKIAALTRGVRPATLSERIELRRAPAEIGELADTLNGMLERLDDSFQRISRFSSDMAHELRTPVNNLRAGIEVTLAHRREAAEYEETLRSGLEECTRLSRLIDRLLFLARAEDPRTQIRRDRLNLRRELETIREFYDAAAGEHGVSLGVRLDGEVEAEIDRTLFQRAMGNLVENALAHTPRGGFVELGARESGSGAVVWVEDSGAGILPEQLPHVFDRLYRGDGSRAAASGGSGLGLAIVKSVAELHGGSARIESEANRGTRVTLDLPSAGVRTNMTKL